MAWIRTFVATFGVVCFCIYLSVTTYLAHRFLQFKRQSGLKSVHTFAHVQATRLFVLRLLVAISGTIMSLCIMASYLSYPNCEVSAGLQKPISFFYVLTHFFSFCFLFIKVRTVKPFSDMSLFEKVLALGIVGMIPFGVISMVVTSQLPITIQGEKLCGLWVALPLACLMEAASITLSSLLLYLFIEAVKCVLLSPLTEHEFQAVMDATSNDGAKYKRLVVRNLVFATIAMTVTTAYMAHILATELTGSDWGALFGIGFGDLDGLVIIAVLIITTSGGDKGNSKETQRKPDARERTVTAMTQTKTSHTLTEVEKQEHGSGRKLEAETLNFPPSPSGMDSATGAPSPRQDSSTQPSETESEFLLTVAVQDVSVDNSTTHSVY